MNHIETTPQELVTQAIAACQSLNNFLEEENIALRERDIKKLEIGVKEKRRLAATMEGLLNAINNNKELIKQDITAKTHLKSLQTSLDDYKTGARKNMILLQAAHESSAGFLNMIRQAVTANRPQVNTYGNDGAMADNSGKESLINKSI